MQAKKLTQEPSYLSWRKTLEIKFNVCGIIYKSKKTHRYKRLMQKIKSAYSCFVCSYFIWSNKFHAATLDAFSYTREFILLITGSLSLVVSVNKVLHQRAKYDKRSCFNMATLLFEGPWLEGHSDFKKLILI